MNIDVLRQELEADISLRASNMTTLVTMPSRYAYTEADRKTHIRGAFPIIYAEWEGFFVFAMSSYIRSVNAQHVTLDSLDERYYINHLEKSFKQIREYPNKISQQSRYLYDLKTHLRNVGDVALATVVNTESNLGFKVTNNILELYKIERLDDHIDHNSYSLKDDMDKFLLDKRNGLAHGDPTATISMDDIINGKHLVERLMEEIKERILKAAQDDVYLKG